MSGLYRREKNDGKRIFIISVISAVAVVSLSFVGYFLHAKKMAPQELSLEDVNDAPPLGVEEPDTQPEEPTPPPPEEEPTPPPLDKPPEFEIPEPTPTPKPPAQPKPPVQKVEQKAPPTTGIKTKGVPTGVAGGTGDGGPRGNKFLRSPKPPYPQQALALRITGAVRVSITITNGVITNVSPVSGPSMLSSEAVRWIKNNWKPYPGVSGTFNLPVNFVMH